MTGQQRAVLWIGLILVGLNLVGNWSKVRDVIFAGAGIGIGVTGDVSGNGGGGTALPGTVIVAKKTPGKAKAQVT